MSNISKFIALKEYIPSGTPLISQFELKSKEINLDEQNNILVQNLWISVDPYMRARMTEKKNYKAPYKLGEPMEGACIGKIIESNSSDFSIDNTSFRHVLVSFCKKLVLLVCIIYYMVCTKILLRYLYAQFIFIFVKKV